MYVTTTEFRRNVKRYIGISESEDVYITVKGEVVTVLTNPNMKRLERVRSVYGIIPAVDDETERQLKMQRLLSR